jgi:light-regulated signal transduction histidine kinase (bacteriophytochrome)
MSQVAQALALGSMPDPTFSDWDAASVLRHAAHELRQPLSTMESIAYYLELILPDADERGRQHLEKLRQLVEQSNWIVTNAIDVVRDAPATPEFVDIAVLLCDVADEMNAPLIEMRIPDSLPMVRLDPEQGRRLVQNLITFLRQSADQRYPMTVCGSYNRDVVSIEASVRRPKKDAEAHALELPAGSSLSLASIRRIVEANGGAVDVYAGDDCAITVRLRLQS